MIDHIGNLSQPPNRPVEALAATERRQNLQSSLREVGLKQSLSVALKTKRGGRPVVPLAAPAAAPDFDKQQNPNTSDEENPDTTLIIEHKEGGTCQEKTYVNSDLQKEACKENPLFRRLERYQKAHVRALQMAEFLSDQQAVRDRARKLRDCGAYLLFRDYVTVDEVRLHAANFCQQDRLCPLCAIRRGAKLLRRYSEKLLAVINNGWSGVACMATFTIRNGPDLRGRIDHLLRSIKTLQERRQDWITRRWSRTELAVASAGVYSVEIKRGRFSELWHPHLHAALLCSRLPDQQLLRDEWLEITGDSHQVDVRPFHFQRLQLVPTADLIAADFLEVFKYALKFSSMSCADNWHAFAELFGRRLIRSFGDFRNSDLRVDDLTDDLAPADLPYVERLFRFISGSYVETSTGEIHLDSIDTP